MNPKLVEVVLVFGILVLLVTGFTPSWTQTSATTNKTWLAVASSADGKIVCTITSGSPAILSTNGGNTWTTNGNLTAYVAIAASADGTKLIMSAFTNSGIYILVSTNFGNIWNQTILPNGNWLAVASSADGGRLVAAIDGGFIYASTNSGATWNTNTALSKNWVSLASSADGNQVVAAASGDKIYISANAGLSWASTGAPTKSWRSICSSSNGKILAATDNVGTYISTNAGGSWMTTNIIGQSVACSSDGRKLIVGGDQIWTSTDSGMTWETNNTPSLWYAVASSADGCKLAATSHNHQGIWVGQITPCPQLNLQPTNGNFALSWIVPSTNFVLEQNLDLSAANWAAVTNAPVLNLANLQEQVSLPATNRNGFFRLIAQ